MLEFPNLLDDDLEKGVKQRKFPYNPERDTPYIERVDVEEWTDGSGDWQDREALAEYKMHPNAFKRAMIDLSAKTDSRINEHGEREYLLHRGMSEDEFKSRIEDNNLGTHSSWTPDKDIAQEFAHEYDNSAMSSWVPESKIHYVPNNIGDTTGTKNIPTKPYHKREHEIIVKPHDFKYEKFTPMPLNDDSLHGIINSRKTGIHNSPKNLLERRRNKPKDWSSDDLEKDVGRITFPELDPKMTRPDQEVKTIDNTKKYKIKETDPVMAGYGDGMKTVKQPEIEARKMTSKISFEHPPAKLKAQEMIRDSLGHTASIDIKHDAAKTPHSEKTTHGRAFSDNRDHKPLGAYKTKEYDNAMISSTKEHEGLHHLVSGVAHKHGMNEADIYHKMNSMIHPGAKEHLEGYMSRAGYSESENHKEYVSQLRDMLVNKTKREKALGHLPDSIRHEVTTQMKRDFKKIRDWAKTARKKDI